MATTVQENCKHRLGLLQKQDWGPYARIVIPNGEMEVRGRNGGGGEGGMEWRWRGRDEGEGEEGREGGMEGGRDGGKEDGGRFLTEKKL